MRRRNFLHTVTALGAAAAAPAPLIAVERFGSIRAGWRSLLPANVSPPEPTDLLRLDEEAWRNRLTPERFHVMRQEATERPYTSELNDEDRPGVYLCAACDLPLFTSAMKFDPGTGWPSFFTTIPGALETRTDRFLFFTTIEYHCLRCGGHQGHVFDDGPEPTHERWCNNGIALRFLAKDAGAD